MDESRTTDGAVRESGETAREDAEEKAGPDAPVEPSALQDAQARAEGYWNELVRARADLANMQRRAERDLENAYKYNLERFASALVPVIDSLEMGLQAAAADSSPDSQKLREGMELTLKLLSDAVTKFGIQAIDPGGEKFNAALHQAMSVQPVSGVEANRVVAVYQKGYLLNDRLIRPAMVVVSGPGAKAPAEHDAAGGKIDETA